MCCVWEHLGLKILESGPWFNRVINNLEIMSGRVLNFVKIGYAMNWVLIYTRLTWAISVFFFSSVFVFLKGLCSDRFFLLKFLLNFIWIRLANILSYFLPKPWRKWQSSFWWIWVPPAARTMSERIRKILASNWLRFHGRSYELSEKARFWW